MAKFFRFPFALIGDRTAIPDESQPSGAVSYNQGFGPDYERDPSSDPLAKRVPRNETNQYLYDITDNIRDYQLWGSPEWVPASANGGSPVSYGVGAQVRYDAGAGVQLWQSIAANNTATPGSDNSKWVVAEPFNFTTAVASQAEIEAGAVNNKIVTPLGLTYRTATPGRTGLAALATNAEVIAGTNGAKIVTPSGLAALTATEGVAGLAALATVAEVLAGVNSAKIVTPFGLASRVATAARTGIAALASVSEVRAATNADKIVTPATLRSVTPRRALEVYSTPGNISFTVPADVYRVYVEVTAGGGSGGKGARATGGAAGGQALGWMDVSPGQVINGTVGAGGASIGAYGTAGIAGGSSSFGAFSATGGAGGNWAGDGGDPLAAYGGMGSGGQINIGLGDSQYQTDRGGGLGGGPGGGTGGRAGMAPGAGGGGHTPSTPSTTSSGAGANGLVTVAY